MLQLKNNVYPFHFEVQDAYRNGQKKIAERKTKASLALGKHIAFEVSKFNINVDLLKLRQSIRIDSDFYSNGNDFSISHPFELRNK